MLAISLFVALLSTSAANATSSGRMPGGIRQATVIVTFPPRPGAIRSPYERVVTNAKKVQALVAAVNALKPATTHVICPAIAILGPVLTVVYRAGPAGPALAQTRVGVSTGSHGDSGSSSCFPITFAVRGTDRAALVGNAYVRLAGRLSGISIS